MTRERFLDPEVCKSEQVARLKDPWAKLLWDRIIVTSDDQGRRKGSGYSLKADCFPCDGISIEQVEVCRDALAEVDLIRLYKDGDDVLLDIPREKWTLYQKLKYAKASRYPDFPGSGEIRPNLPEPDRISQNQPESVTGCGVEGRGEEGSGGESASAALQRAAAEAGNEDTRTFVVEPVPTAPETATDLSKETMERIRRQELKAWLSRFDAATATWPDSGHAPAMKKASERIELGYDAAQMVFGHVVDINRRPSKRPWGTLSQRLDLCRTPSDAALSTAGQMLRAEVAGPGPPTHIVTAEDAESTEKGRG